MNKLFVLVSCAITIVLLFVAAAPVFAEGPPAAEEENGLRAPYRILDGDYWYSYEAGYPRYVKGITEVWGMESTNKYVWCFWETRNIYLLWDIDYLYVSGGLERDGGYYTGGYNYCYDCTRTYTAREVEYPAWESHDWVGYAYHYYYHGAVYDSGWTETRVCNW